MIVILSDVRQRKTNMSLLYGIYKKKKKRSINELIQKKEVVLQTSIENKLMVTKDKVVKERDKLEDLD